MRFIGLLAASAALSCSSLPAGGGAFLAGAAEVEITPPVGWRMAGGYHESLSTGVRDPLMAKALVLEQGGCRSALVVLDLCSIGREVSDRVRARVSRDSGIPVERIVVSATHTHGGPEYYGVLWEVWHEAAAAKGTADLHRTADYVALLEERIARAVSEADARKRPARIEAGSSLLPGIAFNRRYHMSGGAVVTNPGKRRPGILRPAGPVDEDLPVVLFREADTGRPFALLTLFAMHVAVHGGTEFSADYPGHLQRALREKLGGGFISLFAEGTAGDVNHVDVGSDRPQPPDTEPKRIGAAMAAKILETLPGLREVPPRLGSSSTRTSLPLRAVTAQEETRARDTLALRVSPKPPFMDLVAAYRSLWTAKLRARDGAALRAEIQAFRLGDDLAVVTLPHEVFVELGLAIQARSPFRRTLVVTLANDVDFYVPTRKAFGEGGYEVTTSPLEPGGGERLVDAAVALLERLAP